VRLYVRHELGRSALVCDQLVCENTLKMNMNIRVGDRLLFRPPRTMARRLLFFEAVKKSESEA